MIDSNDFFDALSDETRRRLLALLVSDNELCVCELCHALDMPQPKVSRHLAVMREDGVLTVRREGTVGLLPHPSAAAAWAYRILDQMVQGCAGLALISGRPQAPRCDAQSPGALLRVKKFSFIYAICHIYEITNN